MVLRLNKQIIEEYTLKFSEILASLSLDVDKRKQVMLDYYEQLKHCFKKYKIETKGQLAICHSLDIAIYSDIKTTKSYEELKKLYSFSKESNPFYDFTLLFNVLENNSSNFCSIPLKNDFDVEVDVEYDTGQSISSYQVTKDDEELFMFLFIDSVCINNMPEDLIGEVLNLFLHSYVTSLFNSGCLSQKIHTQIYDMCIRLSKIDYYPYNLPCLPVVTESYYKDAFSSSHVFYFEHILRFIRTVYLESQKPKEPYPNGTGIVLKNGNTGKIIGILPKQWIGTDVIGYVVLLDTLVNNYSCCFCSSKDFSSITIP